MRAIPELKPLYLQSDAIVLKYLRHLHPDADASALYQSASKVAACTRQAIEFQRQTPSVNVALRPLLAYYSILHWMKTFLYLWDPAYPPSTSVLQHGLSLRRSKKTAYRWTLESVHVYKEGVMQSFAALPHLRCPVRPKYVVGDVVGSLPGMCDTIRHLYASFQHVYPVESKDDRRWVERRIASNLNLTVDEWRMRYQAAGPKDGQKLKPHQRDPDGMLTLPAFDRHPWHRSFANTQYIWDGSPTPNWMLHFVLLYSLSTLCRYNPLEWSDILTWGNESDSLLVREYLEKYPLDDICEELIRAGSGEEAP